MKELKEFKTNLSESSFKKYENLQKLYESKLNEGYEKVVLGLLSDEGIDGAFAYGILSVAKKDEKRAIEILKNNMKLPANQRDIYAMPKIHTIKESNDKKVVGSWTKDGNKYNLIYSEETGFYLTDPKQKNKAIKHWNEDASFSQKLAAELEKSGYKRS